MKFKSFLTAHKALIKDIATSTCLLGASAGIVFGVSAGMFAIRYMKLSGAEERLNAYKNHAYLSEKISSAWNMNEVKDGEKVTIKGYTKPTWQDMRLAFNEGNEDAIAWWKGLHGADNTKYLWGKYNDMAMGTDEGDEIPTSAQEARYKYTSMVIDGSMHTTMDRSFNQGLYEGLVDFNHNLQLTEYDPENAGANKNSANSYKPSQDNTTDFINTYNSVIKEHDVVGLAGFNHSTPLTTMMTHDGDEAIAKNPDPAIDKELNSTGLILLDSNVANNQNIASVQFRADQPGFLAAIAACQYFYNNLDLYHDKFQDLVVAGYGGVAIPTVMIYLGGFQRGIEFFNYCVLSDSISLDVMKYWTGEEQDEPDARTGALLATLTNLINHSKYKEEINGLKDQGAEKIYNYYHQKLYDEFEVKMIKLGDFDAHFSGTFAAGDAIGITKQYLNRGASAIIAVAGPQSLDSAQEIQNQNSKCIVIGVDSAMEDGDYQRFHTGCSDKNRTNVNLNDKYVDKTVDAHGNHSQQANSIIKFSAIKDIKSVSKKITKLCAEGKNWDINTAPWNHDETIEWRDECRLDASKVNLSTVTESGKNTCTILGFKDGVTWDKDQLIVPATIRVNDIDYEVRQLGPRAFQNAIDSVEALKFETPTRMLLSNHALAMTRASDAHIRYVDIPDFDGDQYFTVANGSFDNWPELGVGKIHFGPNTYDSQRTQTFADMLNAGDLTTKWSMVEADPEKSVCGPGFQTCGNIQNGLISISFDGFVPFMQAMMCVPFYDKNDNATSLSDAWYAAARAYIIECFIKNIPIDENYEEICERIDRLMTFARTDDSGKTTLQFANYNHTMAILGLLLSQAKIPFTADMTLVPDGQGGFTTLTGSDPVNLSIIDWLDYNMYMMS